MKASIEGFLSVLLNDYCSLKHYLESSWQRVALLSVRINDGRDQFEGS